MIASNPTANSPPPKPWEQVGSSGPTPFTLPSPSNTSDVVEALGTVKPDEIVSTANINGSVNTNTLGYDSGFSSGMYGRSYGGLGRSYGGGMYRNGLYRGGLGGMYRGSSLYRGGIYGGRLGGPMGGYGLGMGTLYGNQDPNNPFGPPSSPPGFWISFLRVMEGVVNLFGRIANLIDQNT